MLCPSAQPDWKGSRAFGVILGTTEEPRFVPLTETVPVTPELLKATEPALPAEVLRFAAPCARTSCQHFSNDRCHLAEKFSRRLPVVTAIGPPCPIRRECRWFAQEGTAACLRCPQVVTTNRSPTELMQATADPTTPVSAPGQPAVPTTQPRTHPPIPR
jgi:hypothetical protein